MMPRTGPTPTGRPWRHRRRNPAAPRQEAYVEPERDRSNGDVRPPSGKNPRYNAGTAAAGKAQGRGWSEQKWDTARRLTCDNQEAVSRERLVNQSVADDELPVAQRTEPEPNASPKTEAYDAEHPGRFGKRVSQHPIPRVTCTSRIIVMDNTRGTRTRPERRRRTPRLPGKKHGRRRWSNGGGRGAGLDEPGADEWSEQKWDTARRLTHNYQETRFRDRAAKTSCSTDRTRTCRAPKNGGVRRQHPGQIRTRPER